MEECQKNMVLAVPRTAATAEVAAVQVVDSAEWPLYLFQASSLMKLTRV
jgi:hypothetical protein